MAGWACELLASSLVILVTGRRNMEPWKYLVGTRAIRLLWLQYLDFLIQIVAIKCSKQFSHSQKVRAVLYNKLIDPEASEIYKNKELSQ